MTDQNSDSGQAQEEDGQPSPTTPGAGDKHNSSSASQPQDALGERLTRIEKMLSSFQSGKDRAIDKTRSEVDELRKAFSDVQTLMKKGLSEEEAFDELEGRKVDSEFKQAVLELRDALKGGKSLPVQAGGAQAVPSVVEVLNSFKELDANDPDVVSKVLSLTDAKEAEFAALKLIRQRTAQKPPSPSAAATIAGKPSSPANVETLTKKYQNDMIAGRGNKELGNSIKTKARKDGVPVDSVTFSV
mgnify:CR=1 FL=1